MAEENEPKKYTQHAPNDETTSLTPKLLYERNVARPSHAEYARTIASKMHVATLCTVSQRADGFPYGSFVTYAMHEGNPVFLISQLAEHTKNLIVDSKASLLIAESGEGNPLAHGRVTLVGHCTLVPENERDAVKKCFLEIHESASAYSDWDDFGFYKLKVDSIRFIGGFGRMSWVNESKWFDAEPDPMIEFGDDIVEHMNDDHSDALVLYCKAMSKATDTIEAKMTAIDRYGFEMLATTSDGQFPIRLAFKKQVDSSDSARIELVKMVKEARKLLKTE